MRTLSALFCSDRNTAGLRGDCPTLPVLSADTGSGLQQAMGRVLGSLCVLTCRDDDAESGMLASWVSETFFRQQPTASRWLFSTWRCTAMCPTLCQGNYCTDPASLAAFGLLAIAPLWLTPCRRCAGVASLVRSAGSDSCGEEGPRCGEPASGRESLQYQRPQRRG